MKKQFLEAGRIVNTHGVRGEVKIEPWADRPEFLCAFKRFFIDSAPVGVLSSRVQKRFFIAALDGITDIDSAVRLKNKVICIDRADAKLSSGEFFVQDLIGLSVIDAKTGGQLGVLSEVLDLPANHVYVVSGEREILIPAVPEFIVSTDVDGGSITVKLIEGM